jgi:Bacterial PH domain
VRRSKHNAADASNGRRTGGDRALQQSLFDDEQLVMVARPGRLATFPRYVLTLGLYGIWRKRDTSAITDQRVLLGRGVVRRDERSIPLANIDDVVVARRGLYSYVDLTIVQRGRPDGQRVGPLTPRAARRFAREVLRHR